MIKTRCGISYTQRSSTSDQYRHLTTRSDTESVIRKWCVQRQLGQHKNQHGTNISRPYLPTVPAPKLVANNLIRRQLVPTNGTSIETDNTTLRYGNTEPALTVPVPKRVLQDLTLDQLPANGSSAKTGTTTVKIRHGIKYAQIIVLPASKRATENPTAESLNKLRLYASTTSKRATRYPMWDQLRENDTNTKTESNKKKKNPTKTGSSTGIKRSIVVPKRTG